MPNPRLVHRSAFTVIGKTTWISGQDNALFGRFWEQCRSDGLLETLERLCEGQPGPQTGGIVLGVSCVEDDPANRAFIYLIGIEKPSPVAGHTLESVSVPATQWAVFECRGRMPDALVESEIYAFTRWLPESGFVHALAPEMEVYPFQDTDQNGSIYCEFWLPIARKG